MRKLIFVVALCLSAVAFAGEAAKPEEAIKVEAQGEAAFASKESLLNAKDKALEVALREAVNKAVGTYVTGSSEMRDFTLVRDTVVTESAGYVRKYDQIDERIDDERGIVTIKIRAEVAKAAMDKDAAAIRTLLGMKGQKRIYIAIDDNTADSVGAKGAQVTSVIRHGQMDAALREAFRKDGFTCLDPHVVDGKLKTRSAIQALSNPQEAREIANLVGADIIVYGHVTAANTEGEAFQAKVYRSNVTMAVTTVATDSGEVVADLAESWVETDVVNAAGANAKAIATAVKKASEGVRKQLYAAWNKQLMGGQRVSVAVTGLKDFGAFGAFKALLKDQVRGVKDVHSGKFDKGNATMELAISGTVETLANEVQGKVFKGQTIQVTKASGNTLELALGK